MVLPLTLAITRSCAPAASAAEQDDEGGEQGGYRRRKPMRHAHVTISSCCSGRVQMAVAPHRSDRADPMPNYDCRHGGTVACCRQRPSFVDNAVCRSLSQDGPGGTGRSQGASSRGFAIFLHRACLGSRLADAALVRLTGRRLPTQASWDLLVRSAPSAWHVDVRNRSHAVYRHDCGQGLRHLERSQAQDLSAQGRGHQCARAGAGAPHGCRAAGAHRGISASSWPMASRSTTCWCRPSPPCARRPSARSASAISTCS